MPSNEALERKVASIGGATISYLEQGQGVPVVLLHGIGSAAQSWKNQLVQLSARYRVIAWDAPGYGTSSALPAEAPTTGDYTARLREFLGERGVDRCHLVGHSLGALMAARFAVEHRSMVRSLTLASVATGHARLPEDERARLRQGRLDDIAQLGPHGMAEKRGPRLVCADAPADVRRAVIETMAAVRPDCYRQAVLMLSRGDIRADVAALPPELPTQVLYGSEDVITSPQQNQDVAAMRTNVSINAIPAAGHAVYLERPDAFNGLLLDFFDRH